MKSLYRIILLIGFLFLPVSFTFSQQGDREKGIELFKQGSYKEAVTALQKAVKSTPSDAAARTFLGLAQLKLGKTKDAEKSFVKSLEINPNQTDARKALAYTYLLRGNPTQVIKQIAVLKAANALDAEAYYIFGWANLRLGNGDAALESADQAVRLNPKMANAYLLKAHAIMNRRSGEREYAEIAARYGSAADNIGKFIMLAADSAEKTFYRGQQETLRAFAAYYTEREKNKNNTPADTDVNITPLKILTKPRASYTDQARQAGVMGTIRLLVAFAADGQVKEVLVLSGLGYGLDAEAVRAARNIKFESEKRDGKPVMSVKTVEYSFMIY